MRWLAFAVVAVGLGVGLAMLVGSMRFESRSRELVAQLEASSTVETERVLSLEGLPAPVARYLRLALGHDPRPASFLRIRQSGEFRLDESENGRRPFEATQWISTGKPGFVWDARIRMAPFVDVRVRDAYVQGRHFMHARLSNLVSLVNERDKRELHLGALQRYLAEAVWFPSALLPGGGVEWTQVSANVARATVEDSGHEVSVEFQFDGEGRIVEVFAPERYREIDGRYVTTPWRGRFRSYEERGGVLVPASGEVEWVLPNGPFTYWWGRIRSIECEH